MSEHDYRQRIAAVLEALERHAKRALRPAAVGLALFAGTACGDDTPKQDAYIPSDASVYGVDVYIPTDAHPYGVDTAPFQPPPDGGKPDSTDDRGSQ